MSCTSSSTGSRPTSRCSAGSTGSNPLQGRIFGGCHLDRPIVDSLRAAGFEVREVDAYYEKGSPKFLGANSLGVAVSP